LLVTTKSSAYEIDLAEMTARRIPGEDASSLRKDEAPIPLLEKPEPVIGQSMVLLLAIRDDGVVTVRRTTPVVSIDD
jgi:hypothetical protein